MKSTRIRIIIPIFLIGLLSACGGEPADTSPPASQPTDQAVTVTETPTTLPPVTDTASATETLQPTEIPTEEPTNEPAPATATVSFANDIAPILQSRCVNCHGGERTEEGLNLNTYDDLMAGSQNGLVVTAGDAADSLMAELLLTNKMPKRGPRLTPTQVQLIIDWIDQGARNN